jgi:hypothetical protein
MQRASTRLLIGITFVAAAQLASPDSLGYSAKGVNSCGSIIGRSGRRRCWGATAQHQVLRFAQDDNKRRAASFIRNENASRETL